MILCANPQAQYLAHKEEIDEAVKEVLDSGWYVLGEQVKEFEREFAAYIGVGAGIGVGSGTEALHLAIAACGIGRGDEVITVSHTAVATVAAIELAGATPVLVDIDPVHFTMDPGQVSAAITPRTKAIIPVHIYGQPVDIDAIMEIAKRHGLRVIEDCAQAHGATCGAKRVGAFGDLACFSFYPTKNLGALGDGGMVVGTDEALLTKAQLLREYGWAERFISHFPGWNTRLDEMQAAVLRVKLRYLDADNQARCRIAEVYDGALSDTNISVPRVRSDVNHVYHLYVVRSPQRDELQQFLRDRDIGAAQHYPAPVHLQPAYQGRLADIGDLPETERAVEEILSLPVYPELRMEDVNTVAETIKDFL